MNGRQALEDVRVLDAWILPFDHADKPPDGFLAVVRRGDGLTGQTTPEPAAETDFRIARDGRIVQVVVRVRVEHAVREDRGRQPHLPPQQHLKGARRPGVAAGLENIRSCDGGIEAPRLARQGGADGRKPLAQQQIDMAVLEFEAARGEALKGGRNPAVSGCPLRPGARQAAHLGPQAFQKLQQGSLSFLLLVLGVGPFERRQGGRALLPKLDGFLEQRRHFYLEADWVRVARSRFEGILEKP